MDTENPMAVVVDGSPSFDFNQERYVTMNILGSDNCVATLSIAKDVEGYYHCGDGYDEDGNLVYRYGKEDDSGEFLEVPIEEAYHNIILKSGKTIYELPYYTENYYRGLTFIYPDSIKSILLPGIDVSDYSFRYFFKYRRL